MTASGVVRRYASALYAAADHFGVVDRVTEDLALVRRTIQENPKLHGALAQGVVMEGAKKRILQKVFGEHVHIVTLHFLDLLVDRRREDALDTIEFAFRRVADERRGLQRAEVVSAVTLTGEELGQTQTALEALSGKKIEIEQKVDPGIIGGLVIRVGDRLIDGSVRGQLGMIGKALAGVG